MRILLVKLALAAPVAWCLLYGFVLLSGRLQ